MDDRWQQEGISRAAISIKVPKDPSNVNSRSKQSAEDENGVDLRSDYERSMVLRGLVQMIYARQDISMSEKDNVAISIYNQIACKQSGLN